MRKGPDAELRPSNANRLKRIYVCKLYIVVYTYVIHQIGPP